MKEIRNGQLIAAREEAEPDGAVGVFETLRVWDGAPFFFDEHARRCEAGCRFFNLTSAPNADALRRAAEQLIQANAIRDGVLRWAIWRGANSTAEWRMQVEPPRPHMQKAVWRACFAAAKLPAAADPAAAHKHFGRRAWLGELSAARTAGLDEAVLIDAAGRLIEGTISNIVLIATGRLLTPSLECGPLPGLARARSLAWAAELGIAAREAELTVADTAQADEIFLTNSLIGLRPLAALDGKQFAAPGPVTARLQAEWHRRCGWL